MSEMSTCKCHGRDTRRLIGYDFLRDESNSDLVTMSFYTSLPSGDS